MNDEVVLSVNQLAEQEGIDYQTASGLLRYLREKGIAVKEGNISRPGKGKGRTAETYRLPRWWTLNFGAPEQASKAA